MTSSPDTDERESTLYRGADNLPVELWHDLAAKRPESVCHRACVSFQAGNGYLLPFLGSEYLVDPEEQRITALKDAYRVGFQSGLVMLAYLIHASDHELAGRMVTGREIKGGDFFFQGPHALSKDYVLQKHGRDAAGFLRQAETLDATPLDIGDAAIRMLALPKIPVAYTLYTADEEFPARLVITFDAAIEKHLPLDAIFALVNIISQRLSE
jgi:hypothetical protein